ncbi:hypothetical protein CYMTET_3438 [Cymbomonas tetramitiformis]|uniref:Homeobox domain-containing protein n=1 Tax=Cymbomonas tetramitiformis TaxID=36881 RepID=A0AAE0LLD3_9CHLO|nr:hypothetical protein CYMTET_3438 [Cymbomonas tetramitiformis]
MDADGLEEHCRWCGDGGELGGCDFCIHSFCSRCISHNFGAEEYRKITGDAEGSKVGQDGSGENAGAKWQCYLCDQEPLRPLQEAHTAVLTALQKVTQAAPGSRSHFSVKQREELEVAFLACSSLSGARRLELASKVGVTEKQLASWFSNRRSKAKKEREVSVS